MDNSSLLITLIIFVAISAIALLIQAAMLAGMFMVFRELRTKVLPLVPEVQKALPEVRKVITTVQATLAGVQATVGVLEKRIEAISASSVEMVNTSKERLAKIDELLTDATTRARAQMDRAEMVLDDTMGRVTETVSVVQRGVIRPIREVHGVVNGIRTALQYLGRGGRPTVDHATSDEEMFI
jgi:septal ring factor EnvC (AmiA/AmiB activator)